MSSILVTGGAGMIGSNLVKKLTQMGHSVAVVDNLWRGKTEYLTDENKKQIINLKKDFYNRDLTRTGSIDDIIGRFDYIYHLADIVAGIDYVFNNQGDLFRKNILINSNVIASVRKNCPNLKGFIYAGTACSFPLTRQNSLDVVPLREEELYPAMPESAYGWSKLMGQYETELLEKETGIPVCVLMFHNVYGAPCDYGNRSQVIPSLIRKAVNYPDEDFVVWGSGTQGRAFVYVDDIVDALVRALERGLGKGTIQIGPSECTSVKEIAELIAEVSGKPIRITYDTTKPEGDKARSADYSRAKQLLGWEPKTPLREGITKQYLWIQKQISEKPAVTCKPKKELSLTKIKALISENVPLPVFKCILKTWELYKNIKMPEIRKRFGDKNPDKTFYVIRLFPPGSGFLSNYNYVLGYIRRAEKIGGGGDLYPVIDMENYGTLYSEEKPVNGSRNVWEYFFRQPSPYSLSEVYQSKNVILSNGSFQLGDWSLAPQTIEWQSRIARSIQFREPVEQYIKSKTAEILPPGKKIMGVKIRGSDFTKKKPKGHFVQPDIEYVAELLEQKTAEWNIDYIFAATEEEESLEYLKNRFDNILFLPIQRYKNYSKDSYIIEYTPENTDKYHNILSYLTEIYILSKCNALIGAKNAGLVTAVIWNGGAYEHMHIIDLGVY